MNTFFFILGLVLITGSGFAFHRAFTKKDPAQVAATAAPTEKPPSEHPWYNDYPENYDFFFHVDTGHGDDTLRSISLYVNVCIFGGEPGNRSIIVSGSSSKLRLSSVDFNACYLTTRQFCDTEPGRKLLAEAVADMKKKAEKACEASAILAQQKGK